MENHTFRYTLRNQKQSLIGFSNSNILIYSRLCCSKLEANVSLLYKEIRMTKNYKPITRSKTTVKIYIRNTKIQIQKNVSKALSFHSKNL